MIDTYGPAIALGLLAVSIVSLVLFAFGGASKRADTLNDDLIDRIQHGDVRLSDVLGSSFHRGPQ